MFIFFLAVSLILDKGLSELWGGGEWDVVCILFLSEQGKGCSFLKNSVWLSISSQELRPFVLLDICRPGTVRQTMVAKPNEISQFSREVGWISTTCVVQTSARQPATSCQCTTQEHCPEPVP